MLRALVLISVLLFAPVAGRAQDSAPAPTATAPAVVTASAPAMDVASDPASGDPPVREPISGRRIIKHFDFDERPLNNLGTVPLYWRPWRADGFPLYLEGAFDTNEGHHSPPSFRLDLDGGSIAYQYEGNDIAVRANSDYLVVAWVKTAGVKHARAYLTAYFLDRKGNRIPGTEQTTELAGGTGETTGWEPIQVGLTGNVPDARYMGLSVWLVQPRVWDPRPPGPRAIENEDVRATAWFDDITVYRLPRISLTSSSPGNVFPEPAPVVLRPEITDPDGLNLTARLTVTAVDGSFHDERPVPIRAGELGPQEFVYDRLPVGLYNVRLEASTHGTPLVWRTLRFARVPEHYAAPQSAGRRFGVIIEDIEPPAVAGQHALLSRIRPEWVKLPVWYSQRAATGRALDLTESVDRYLQAIVDSGGNPVGIQMDDPAMPLARGVGGLRSMLDILSEDPLAWTPLISGTWSRYTGLIHVWQVGRDGDEHLYLDHRLGNVLASLRREMSTLMSDPELASCVSVRYPAGAGALADYRAINVPTAVMPRDIERHIRPLFAPSPSRTWVTLESLEHEAYPREMRISDYAHRLAEALFLDCGAVFVPAPWEVESDLMATHVCPREEYLVLRTLADILGNAVPVSRTNIDGLAECTVFDQNGQAVLFVWNDRAPPEGYEHLLYLGDYAEQIDLWGRRTALPTVGSRQKVRIGPVPSLIVNTPTWLMEFRRQFVATPSLFEANYSADQLTLSFKNTHREPISGLLRVVGPENWDVRPSRMTFALQPGEEFRQPVDIRFPVNAEAGVKAILGEFSIDSTRRYQIVTPAWFELGLKDIDLDTCVFRKGSNAIVRVSLTNYTSQPVSFDADLIMPARQRLSRLFQNILPGQSVSKEFNVEQANELAGRRVRVHLSERQGNRMWNRVLVIP